MSTRAKTTVRTLRAVEWLLETPGQLDRRVTSLPEPTAEEVLVRTAVGAISPGLERALLHGTCPAVSERAYPYQPGTLNVVEIRRAADRTLVGDRGVAVLGHRDHALVPYARFVRVPAGISDEVALLGVVAADARHAVEVAAVESSEDCLVLGGGIVGTLTAWDLSTRTRGAVRLVEQDERRRDLLKTIRFPAEVKVADRPGRYPFHSVFECANTAAAFETAQAATRAGGSIVLVADGSHEKYTLSDDFFSKGMYLGKTQSSPDLRGFLNDWFVRGEDRSTLVDAAFRDEVRFDEFPQAYLKTVLAAPADRQGLLPRVVY
jgi:2-desacetyl-2-hydroxyethyl bacteriochlorophyllide A dehydrogenase